MVGHPQCSQIPVSVSCIRQKSCPATTHSVCPSRQQESSLPQVRFGRVDESAQLRRRDDPPQKLRPCVSETQRPLTSSRGGAPWATCTTASVLRLTHRCKAENVNSHLPPSAFPDFRYIRESVPILDVARQLGLRIVGKMVHCWRPENHQHGDRTATVGIQQRRNKAKCFVCDALPLSPIDLVMSVLGLNVRAAVQWITSRYNVPAVPKGTHIEHPERWHERFRVGTGSSVEMLVRSGIWASLTPAQRSLIPVLETFADSQTRKVKISYKGLMRNAGVRSQSTVSSALKRFRALRFLRFETNRDSDGLRACGTYRLDWNDPDFLNIASDCYRRHSEQAEQERELRKISRRKRAQQRHYYR